MRKPRPKTSQNKINATIRRVVLSPSQLSQNEMYLWKNNMMVIYHREFCKLLTFSKIMYPRRKWQNYKHRDNAELSQKLGYILMLISEWICSTNPQFSCNKENFENFQLGAPLCKIFVHGIFVLKTVVTRKKTQNLKTQNLIISIHFSNQIGLYRGQDIPG
jgi:hypothetical protein